jgi:hypothetical protein
MTVHNPATRRQDVQLQSKQKPPGKANNQVKQTTATEQSKANKTKQKQQAINFESSSRHILKGNKQVRNYLLQSKKKHKIEKKKKKIQRGQMATHSHSF